MGRKQTARSSNLFYDTMHQKQNLCTLWIVKIQLILQRNVLCLEGGKIQKVMFTVVLKTFVNTENHVLYSDPCSNIKCCLLMSTGTLEVVEKVRWFKESCSHTPPPGAHKGFNSEQSNRASTWFLVYGNSAWLKDDIYPQRVRLYLKQLGHNYMKASDYLDPKKRDSSNC